MISGVTIFKDGFIIKETYLFVEICEPRWSYFHGNQTFFNNVKGKVNSSAYMYHMSMTCHTYEGPSIKFVIWLTISTNHNTDLSKWCSVIDTSFIHNISNYEAYILTQYGCTAHLLEEGSELCQNGTRFLASRFYFTFLSLHTWKVVFRVRQIYENVHTCRHIHLLSLCPILK